MKTSAIVLAAALLLTACGEPSTPTAPQQTPAGTASTSAPAQPSDEVKAHGFITQNSAPPAGAAITRDDGIYRDSSNRPFQYELLGQKLPAFTAPVSDGTIFNSAEINKWTVIDIWGAWCGDCIADGPYVASLVSAIAQDPDLDFLSIHVPANANRTSPEELFGRSGSLEGYFENAGYSVPTVLDNDASLRDLLKVRWTPTYLLVSPDGIVRGFRTDLRVVEDQPIKTFLQDVAEVRKEVRDQISSDPSDIE